MYYYDHIEPVPSAGCAVAMGYFDGVHLGHQMVIGQAVAYAKEHGLDAALFTFELPVNSHIKGRRLMTDADKLHCAEKQTLSSKSFLKISVFRFSFSRRSLWSPVPQLRLTQREQSYSVKPSCH